MERIHTNRYKSNGSIVALIRSQGRSVAWLAREMNVSRQYMSDVVHGRFSVNAEFAELIAKRLDSVIFLLFDVSGSAGNVAMERVA